MTRSFRVDHELIVEAVLAEGPRLLAAARAVLDLPESNWWFASLDRFAQEWIGPTGAAPPHRIGVAQLTSPPDAWERYAQQPADNVVTSTGVGTMSAELADLVYGDTSAGSWQEHPPYLSVRPDRIEPMGWAEGDPLPVGFGEMSSAVAALLYHSGDYEEGEPPLVRYRTPAAAGLRVYEVDGPHAWHTLCVRYPSEGEDGRLVPDWGAVAIDWDGVHLSLGGLLTADQARVDSAAGWTELESWEFEQTRWLRWDFTAIERMPELINFDITLMSLPTPPTIASFGHKMMIYRILS